MQGHVISKWTVRNDIFQMIKNIRNEKQFHGDPIIANPTDSIETFILRNKIIPK